MLKIHKFFIITIFLVLSFPFLFFSWALITLEYQELIKFGDIKQAVIVQEGTEQASSALDFGYVHVYHLKMLNRGKLESKSYSTQIDLNDFEFSNKNETEFIGNVKIGDTVKVKILSNNKVKILKWKNLELNKPISYWGKFGRWLLITILLSIAFYIYCRIYKIIIN